MRPKFWVLIVALLVPLMSEAVTKQQKSKTNDRGMAQAIAFERAKDAADARQARIEAKHPTVPHANSADRDANTEPGQRVPDSGEAQHQDGYTHE